jgi:hypothetical protein
MWETISDLNVHVQVAKASIFFRRYTLLKILPKIGTGLILLAPTVALKKYIYTLLNKILWLFCFAKPQLRLVQNLFLFYEMGSHFVFVLRNGKPFCFCPDGYQV